MLYSVQNPKLYIVLRAVRTLYLEGSVNKEVQWSPNCEFSSLLVDLFLVDFFVSSLRSISWCGASIAYLSITALPRALSQPGYVQPIETFHLAKRGGTKRISCGNGESGRDKKCMPLSENERRLEKDDYKLFLCNPLQ